MEKTLKGGIFASGKASAHYLWKCNLPLQVPLEQKKADTSLLPPTLPCCYQCLSTACWSTDPVPAAPFVQCSLRQPYQIRRLFSTSGAHFFLFTHGYSDVMSAHWIRVQTVTSCSGGTFSPQFHGNLWHFQDVTSTFFTSGKHFSPNFPQKLFNITSAATNHLAGQVHSSPHLFISRVSFS